MKYYVKQLIKYLCKLGGGRRHVSEFRGCWQHHTQQQKLVKVRSEMI